MNLLRKLVEWAISGFCLVGTAALLIQQDWVTAAVIFAFGLGINPLLKANNIIKACLTLMAYIVVFGR